MTAAVDAAAGDTHFRHHVYGWVTPEDAEHRDAEWASRNSAIIYRAVYRDERAAVTHFDLGGES